MTTIKTMKGQAVAAGMNVVDWPADSVIKMLFCFDSDSGGLLDVATPATVKEEISGASHTGGTAILTNNTAGTNTIQTAVSAIAFAGSNNDFGADSFILMYVGDTPASGAIFTIGVAGAQNLSITTTAAASLTFKNSLGTVATMTTVNITGSAAGQLVIFVYDAENNTVALFEGVSGEVALGSADIEVAKQGGTFTPDLEIPSSVTMTNMDGVCMIRCPNGVPTDFQDMCLEIATELRKGTHDGVNYEPAVRRTWANSMIGKYMP